MKVTKEEKCVKFRITHFTCKNHGKSFISKKCDIIVESIEDFRKMIHNFVVCDKVLINYVEIPEEELVKNDKYVVSETELKKINE